MKIDNSGKPTPSTGGSSAARPRTQGAGNAAAAQGGATAAHSGQTEATLSGLQGLDALLASGAVMDTARVAEIKQAISEGRFQVNAEKIADGLLQSVHEMLSATSSR